MKIIVEEYGQALLGLIAGYAVINMFVKLLDYVTSF